MASYAVFDSTEVERLGAQWKGVEAFVGPRGLLGAADVFYRNDGDELTDITAWARLNHPSPGYGLGVLFADMDDDGWPDLFVANDSSPNFFYRNRGDGRFSDRSLPARLAYSRSGQIQASMGTAWGDYDNDGRPDLLATHFEDEYNTLYRNEGDGTFADVSAEAALGQVGWAHVGFGAGFFDYDHDGDLDLLVANGHVYPQIDRAGSSSAYAQPNHLFANVGDGTFTQVALGSEVTRVSRGTNVLDFDNDGDLDVFVANLDDRPSLLRNDVGNRQNWLGLRLVGTHSNRDGIGARARARRWPADADPRPHLRQQFPLQRGPPPALWAGARRAGRYARSALARSAPRNFYRLAGQSVLDDRREKGRLVIFGTQAPPDNTSPLDSRLRGNDTRLVPSTRSGRYVTSVNHRE